ncbi:hypothetical protein HGRIS_004355 [Hohenbuehelia grisea]|uniref:Uncharacterized protein n=1 Tax=Hohenbuehelia grisea TaxID=104357 RepID=A0ABR3JBW8_9AGAR
MQALEAHFAEEGIPFVASDLLEGINTILASDRKCSTGSYQESVTAAVGREHNDDDNPHGEQDADDEDDMEGPLVSPVAKRRRSWLAEVRLALEQTGSRALATMLILDVRTRWSSTHQMLRRALDNKDAFPGFVGKHYRELAKFDLDDDDWATIKMTPMLSTTFAIFRGLQEHLQDILRSLPGTTSSKLKKALLDSHRKLSDYYYKYDESPYYTWAALLDPRIGYERMRDNYTDDRPSWSTLNKPRSLFTTITAHIMQSGTPHLFLAMQPPHHPLHLSPLTARRKRLISSVVTSVRSELMSTISPSSSNCHRKILPLATLCSGGLGDSPNFLMSILLLVTFSPSLAHNRR